jgi:sulfite reductase (NADPH) hemoprotein beta-component
MPDVIERLIDTFVSLREDGERFVDTVARVGPTPFKERVYREGSHAHERLEQAVA